MPQQRLTTRTDTAGQRVSQHPAWAPSLVLCSISGVSPRCPSDELVISRSGLVVARPARPDVTLDPQGRCTTNALRSQSRPRHHVQPSATDGRRPNCGPRAPPSITRVHSGDRSSGPEPSRVAAAAAATVPTQHWRSGFWAPGSDHRLRSRNLSGERTHLRTQLVSLKKK